MGLRLGLQPDAKATATLKANVGDGTGCPLGRTIWGRLSYCAVDWGNSYKNQKCLQTFSNISWRVSRWGRTTPHLVTTALAPGPPGAGLQIMSIFPAGGAAAREHTMSALLRAAQACSGPGSSWHGLRDPSQEATMGRQDTG